jgi:hypothetical protein
MKDEVTKEVPDYVSEFVREEALQQIKAIKLTDQDIIDACFEWQKRKFFAEKEVKRNQK